MELTFIFSSYPIFVGIATTSVLGITAWYVMLFVFTILGFINLKMNYNNEGIKIPFTKVPIVDLMLFLLCLSLLILFLFFLVYSIALGTFVIK